MLPVIRTIIESWTSIAEESRGCRDDLLRWLVIVETSDMITSGVDARV